LWWQKLKEGKMINIPKINKITILFLSWRDIKAPKKGGAEVYTHEMLKRIDTDINVGKYRVIHISPMFEGAKEDEIIDGIRYIRHGSAISVISYARKFYKTNKTNIDLVVDQCNTHRFFTPLWVEKEKRIFFIHQLTREIWYTNSKFPVNVLGAWTETPLLRLSRKDKIMTVSPSTKQDLIDVGFIPENITILPEGIEFKHWEKEQFLPKEKNPTFTYVGRYVAYKGINVTVEALGELKQKYKNAKLWLIGKVNRAYIEEELLPIMGRYNLKYSFAKFSSDNLATSKDVLINKEEVENSDIVIWGFVPNQKKLELMSKSHAIVFPSLREGWGLIITEAAAVGTTGIVYNSPGTRDAVNLGRAGYLCEENTPKEITKLMKRVIEEKEEYQKMRDNAYAFSQKFYWNNTAKEFDRFIDGIIS